MAAPINLANEPHTMPGGTEGAGTLGNHDASLASKAQNLSLQDHDGAHYDNTGQTGFLHPNEHAQTNEYDQDGSVHSQTNDHPHSYEYDQAQHGTRLPNGQPEMASQDYVDGNDLENEELPREHEMDMAPALAAGPGGMRDGMDRDTASVKTGRTRPTLRDEPSRSYIKPIPIITTYEPNMADNASTRRKSVAGSVKAPTVKRSASQAESVRAPTKAEPMRPPSRAESVRSPTIRAESIRPPTNRAESVRASTHRAESVRGTTGVESVRSPSRAGSVKTLTIRSQSRAGHYDDARPVGQVALGGAAGGAAIGEVFHHDRQREMQQQPQRETARVSLSDSGPASREGRHTTFSDHRSTSPRPTSAFGHRPQPNLMAVTEDANEGQYDGRNSRAGMLGRSGTVMSRANTMGRNGTLSRASNGGTVGNRRGAFGRGAGASIGTQPEEVLGRDDIHTRAELSERILGDTTLRRLSVMEKKDARRLSKVIKSEGKAEARAVTGSIKELERLSKLQKQAAGQERKSQMRLSKWTSKEHKARLRFLKEKERYEKVEGELRNAENDYEERRDHAAGLTSQVAEKTQELDDLRGQKAADDREREVKLLALKNPAHS